MHALGKPQLGHDFILALNGQGCTLLLVWNVIWQRWGYFVHAMQQHLCKIHRPYVYMLGGDLLRPRAQIVVRIGHVHFVDSGPLVTVNN